MAISTEGHFSVFNCPERCYPSVHIARVQYEIWITDCVL